MLHFIRINVYLNGIEFRFYRTEIRERKIEA
jgi:hypothetical protein